jgi:hypothetical protein
MLDAKRLKRWFSKEGMVYLRDLTTVMSVYKKSENFENIRDDEFKVALLPRLGILSKSGGLSMKVPVGVMPCSRRVTPVKVVKASVESLAAMSF